MEAIVTVCKTSLLKANSEKRAKIDPVSQFAGLHFRITNSSRESRARIAICMP